jgi:hypothetical protein
MDYISLDIETGTVTVHESCGLIGIEHNYTVEEFKKYYTEGDVLKHADMTLTVQRLIRMDFDIDLLRDYYRNY